MIPFNVVPKLPIIPTDRFRFCVAKFVNFLPSASAVFFSPTFGGLGALKIQYNKKILLSNYWRSIFLSFGYMRSIAMVAGDWVKIESFLEDLGGGWGQGEK